MTFWFVWILFNCKKVLHVSVWQLWGYILNPCPPGQSRHAGRGQATDGTSIPCPGCEFMHSGLSEYPSISIYLAGWPLSRVAELYMQSEAEPGSLKYSFLNSWNAHLLTSKRLFNKHLSTQEKARSNTRVPLVYPSRHSTFPLSPVHRSVSC